MCHRITGADWTNIHYSSAPVARTLLVLGQPTSLVMETDLVRLIWNKLANIAGALITSSSHAIVDQCGEHGK